MRINAFAAGLITSAGITFSVVSSAVAADLKMVSSFPDGFVFTEEIAKPFMRAVEEATQGVEGGAVTLSFTGPDAVPPLEQVEPVQAGVFDVLFTHPAYHAGATALPLSIDAIAPDPAKRTRSRHH